ncbi:hypothetical protein [Sphingomonas sp. Leaf23]|uniref:hypothetical protein n=1 Tax=Sphingomonas sp. Leaf23 TaxID=1735689 RepID=UPI000A5FB6C8|nr:hypothetical protein [Sphingomonas sp. Leaf23]
MAHPRTPAAKAKATGADQLHPGRHKGRSEPKSSALGKPSPFLDLSGQQAWEGFRRELPWLMESDRALVEIASSVRGRLLAGEDVGVTALSMLQSILSKLGGSPADRSKVALPDDEKERDEFFGDS